MLSKLNLNSKRSVPAIQDRSANENIRFDFDRNYYSNISNSTNINTIDIKSTQLLNTFASNRMPVQPYSNQLLSTHQDVNENLIRNYFQAFLMLHSNRKSIFYHSGNFFCLFLNFPLLTYSRQSESTLC
jgi:hypothetical protein